MFVKICGITSPEDASVAEEAGADAIGMIFVAGSKREVDLERGAEIASAVGPFVTKVGVFRDASVDEVRDAVRRLRLDAVQLHGAEGPDVVAELRPDVEVIKALAFRRELTVDALLDYRADAILLDGWVAGSGRTFDWRAAERLAGTPRLIVAGGLDPANVADAVAALHPYAVDVASGVEASPGVKDPDKVRDFVARAKRAADRGGVPVSPPENP